MENEPTFTIHGARGTMAVSGRAFTHFHLDHVIGLPLFKPLYRQGALHEQGDQNACHLRLIASPFYPS